MHSLRMDILGLFNMSEIDTWSIVTFLSVLVTLFLNYYLWFVPMNRIRTLEDIGFGSGTWSSGKRKQMWANRVMKARKQGQKPPDFPNGWFVLAESREVPNGGSIQVSALGRTYAIFRGTESGKIFVTDPYCPHLGANMVLSGGKVSGDCIECPFHEWTFNGTSGQCVRIPYAKKIPDFAKLHVHHSVEMNDLIFVWHHKDTSVEPSWMPPEILEISNGSWVYQGRNEYEISCHIQDIPENGADVAHLSAIHKSSILVGGEPSRWIENLFSQFAWHEWAISWSPDEQEGQTHRALVKLEHSMKIGGGFDLLSMQIQGEQIGPALVHLFFDTAFGKGVMIQYVTPLEPMLQKIVHVFYTERIMIPPLAKLVLYGESVLLERDIRVWNTKTYLMKPLLVKEDALILKHRRWYSQFYSDKTSREKDSKSLDW